MLDRRTLLVGAMAGAGLLVAPGLAVAQAATERRLVFILQRGAADGLATLAPVGDPGFADLRRLWLDSAQGGTAIGDMFRLHPALPTVGELYGAGEAAILHAAATGYRERSHFDAQYVLETGNGRGTGWLNRLLGLLPRADSSAVALAASLPMALQGPQPASNYTPSRAQGANDDLLARVQSMYSEDMLLTGLLDQALATTAMAESVDVRGQNGPALGARAAALLTAPGGARVAMIESTGWDTHFQQETRLATALTGLDGTIAALRDGLGAHWADTLVVVATEFGRTAHINGSRGTDHGTGALAMVLGGGVTGGRVLGDWPGLQASQLHDDRDLAPANSVEALIGGAVAGHYRLDPGEVMRTLFPSASTPALTGIA